MAEWLCVGLQSRRSRLASGLSLQFKDDIIDIKTVLLAFLLQNSFEVGPDMVSIDDLECMTINMYHEARGEPVQGQIAVGNVVKNRMKHPNFPSTICDVVYERKQFSWYSDGISDRVKDYTALYEAAGLSILLLADYILDNTNGALYYYNPHMVQPYWANAYDYRITYANHIFLN